jgi:hypothetical protein
VCKKERSGGGGGESLWSPLMERKREKSHVDTHVVYFTIE